MLPGSSTRSCAGRCVVVEAVLVVEDAGAAPRALLAQARRQRPAERYLARFDEIRQLQDHFADAARAEGVAVIENVNVDDTLAQLMDLVLDAVTEVT